MLPYTANDTNKVKLETKLVVVVVLVVALLLRPL